MRGRKKKETPSTRLRLGEGLITLGSDKQVDELYQEIKSLPRGTRFRTVMAWLIAGRNLEAKVSDDDLSEIRRAAEDIVDNFVF